MATGSNKASKIEAIKKAWMKWNDSAVLADEKKTIAETINKILLKLELVIDWKTGIVSPKPVQQATSNAGKAEQSAKATAKATGGWTTKELATYLSEMFKKEISPKNLRRHLRTMPEYNDGRMTHYSWSGQNDVMIKKIIDSMFKNKSA